MLRSSRRRSNNRSARLSSICGNSTKLNHNNIKTRALRRSQSLSSKINSIHHNKLDEKKIHPRRRRSSRRLYK